MELLYVRDFPFQFLQGRYEDSQNWGEKSDILRFEILYREGGVYVDHDANCLKSFAPFHLTHDLYAGLEAPHPAVAGRCITLGNGVIGSRPNHPTVRRVLDIIDKSWDNIDKKYRGRDGYSSAQRVMERTYIALTEALEEGLRPPGTVFPCAYFFAKGAVAPLYSKHFYANSWATDGGSVPPTEKRFRRALAQLKQRTEKLTLAGWISLGLNLLAFLCLFFYYRKRAGVRA